MEGLLDEKENKELIILADLEKRRILLWKRYG